MGKASREVQWRVITNASDYEINEFGDVRRITRARTRFAGHMPKGHSRGGYRAFKLAASGGKRTFWAHRLVIEAFVGAAPSEAHVVAHGDGDRLNNHISNLRWATIAENNADTALHGSLKGARNPRAKLTREQVAEARSSYSGRFGEQSAIARRYGISHSAMRSILVRRHWSHV